jgi:hypothetical protein
MHVDADGSPAEGGGFLCPNAQWGHDPLLRQASKQAIEQGRRCARGCRQRPPPGRVCVVTGAEGVSRERPGQGWLLLPALHEPRARTHRHGRGPTPRPTPR